MTREERQERILGRIEEYMKGRKNTNRGTAGVQIAKHRNGPTRTVQERQPKICLGE